MTAAMLVLEPIFEADLPSELYAYRPGRNAQQAVVAAGELLAIALAKTEDEKTRIRERAIEVPRRPYHLDESRKLGNAWTPWVVDAKKESNTPRTSQAIFSNIYQIVTLASHLHENASGRPAVSP